MLKRNNKAQRNLGRRFLYSVRFRIHAFIRRICSLFPLKEKYIVLESEGDYTDNIRAFYDYMIEHNYNKFYKLIWIVHCPAIYPKHNNVSFVSRYGLFSFKANYYCAVSKFFLFSHPYWFRKVRDDQIIINTTHSVAQLKAPSQIATTIPFDYLLVCSPYCREIKKKAFSISDNHILNIGMPRVDLMFHHTDCIRRLVPDYQGQKIILSMQTFKQTSEWIDSSSINPYALNVIHSKEEIEKLDEYLAANHYILINKIHHLQNMSCINQISTHNIIYITDADLFRIGCITNNLLENADILFTDYSSVFYEFLLKDLPIGFLIGDIDEYSRGFIMKNPLENMPGDKIRSYEEMVDFLNKHQEYGAKYAPERERIKNLVFSYADDHNCDRLYQWIQSQNGR